MVGIARGAEALDAVEAELRESSEESWTRAGVDVGDERAVRGLVDDVVERHARLDILINNAGIEARRPVAELTTEHVREIMRVNFEGVVHGTVAVVPHMRARREGWIVSLSSGVSRAPVPMEAAYAASKAALVAFSESISYELAREGIRVKVLWPGFVGETRMAAETVAQGMPIPPRMVHRSPERVSGALLRHLDDPGFEINVARLETVAPIVRTLLPRIYRRQIVKTQGL